MNTEETHLSNKEMCVLRQLSRGKSYEEMMKLPNAKWSLQDLYTLAIRIRKKTRLHSLDDQQAVRDWLYHHPTGRILPGYCLNLELTPSPTQRKVMRGVADGRSISEIAQTLGMGRQTALNHLSTGCRRAGIQGHGPYRKRRDFIALWFEEQKQTEPAKPAEASRNVEDY